MNNNGTNANQVHKKNRIIEAMYNDVIRGKQKYQVREKFTSQGYDENICGERTFFSYWNDMMDKFAEEFEENKKQLKSKFISRYLFLYEKMIEKNDLKGAREVLDSLKKMTGMDEPIEANIDLSGELIVDFGLGDETEV
jgi:hypothetical protein